MIWVKIKTREGKICSIEITGHAEFAEHGKDIVCAAVSSIGTGLLNAIDEMCPGDCELLMGDNLIKIEVIHDSEKLQSILNTGYYQFKTVSKSFNLYVRVRKSEVRK